MHVCTSDSNTKIRNPASRSSLSHFISRLAQIQNITVQEGFIKKDPPKTHGTRVVVIYSGMHKARWAKAKTVIGLDEQRAMRLDRYRVRHSLVGLSAHGKFLHRSRTYRICDNVWPCIYSHIL